MDIDLITHQLSGISFDLYLPEDIRKTSIKQITEQIAFDNIGRPTSGGLYDPAMGISPYDKTSLCVTCNLDSNECPGHFGHIELPTTLYNPFLIGNIYKLLNAKCFNCHSLRLREKDKKYYYIKILLLKLGLISEAEHFHNIFYSSFFKNSESTQDEIISLIGKFISSLSKHQKLYSEYNNSIDFSNHQDEINNIDDQNESISNTTATFKNQKLHDKKKGKKDKKEGGANDQYSLPLEKVTEGKLKNISEIFIKVKNRILEVENGESLNDQNTDIQYHLKSTMKEFWNITKVQKCSKCDSFAFKIKKQGYLKFFKLPLSEGKAKEMKGKKLSINKDAFEHTTHIDKKKKSKNEFEEESESDEELELNEKYDQLSTHPIKSDVVYLHHEEVKEQIRLLWNSEIDILSLIFGNIYKKQHKNNIFSVESSGYMIFFIQNILVTPNRFRPENRGSGDGVYLHHQSSILTKVLNISSDIRRFFTNNDNQNKNKNSNQNSVTLTNEDINSSKINYRDLISKWIELQDTVNILYDGQKASKLQDKEITGIRQLIEKKEGIFRMKMMGKRVNHAGRSVVSPDPMISTGEVGIPLYIAAKLCIPEEVTDFNKERLKTFIINGAFKYPGANMIETVSGKKILLDSIKEELRINKLAKSLDESPENENKFRVKTVYRHLQTGDALLVNRQPTLHRPSIMSHKAKILQGEKTIRLHYANCSSYNADFDGDEMNIHFLQNHIAREEAYSISNTENQYIVPTSGNPIRGLIQDSIVSAVFLTMKDNFFTRQEVFQLLYSSLEGPLNSKTISHIVIPEPAIVKPQFLWTGKQVITSVLKSLITLHPVFGNKEDIILKEEKELMGLNLESKTRLDKGKWGESHVFEGTVIIRGNELLTGIIDKNQIGNSTFGIVHSYYEIYGPMYAGELLTVLCKLLINYLQFTHGFTCGVGDLVLNNEINLKRRYDIENILKEGINSLASLFNMSNFNLEYDNFSNRSVLHVNKDDLQKSLLEIPQNIKEDVKKIIRLQDFHISDDLFKHKSVLVEELESKEKLTKSEKEKIKDLKSSIHNEDEIYKLKLKIFSEFLKDDSIENSLDSSIKAAVNSQSKCLNQWINHGLQKKFPSNLFSIMVGTGAKGSQLNHTLISCLLGQQELEGKRVPRMASGRTLPSFGIFDPNPRSGGFIGDRFATGIRMQEFFFHCMAGREGLIDTAVKTSRSGYLQRCLIKHLEQLIVSYDNTVRDTDGKVIQFLYGEDSIDPCKSKYINNFEFIYNNKDSYKMKFSSKGLNDCNENYRKVKEYIKENPNLIHSNNTLLSLFEPSTHIGSKSNKIHLSTVQFADKIPDRNKTLSHQFKKIVDLKYFNSLVHPGENVGIIAAQGIGEPSTQMTLNTFHLAGHGGANMTLGIPRLREILMTSENNIKTPIMILYPYSFLSHSEIEQLSRHFERYFLIDIVKHINIESSLKYDDNNKQFNRKYKFDILLEKLNDIEAYFGHKIVDNLKDLFKDKFLKLLSKSINKQYKMAKEAMGDGIKIQIFKEKEGNFIKEENEEKKNEENEDDEKKNRNVKIEEDSFSDDSNETFSHDKEIENENEIEDENNGIEEGDNIKIEVDDNLDEKEEKPNNKEDKKNKDFYYGDIHIQNLRFKIKEERFSFALEIPYTQKPILLKNITDEILKTIHLRSIVGIKKSHMDEKKDKNNQPQRVITLEGVNFDEVFKFGDKINLNKIESNDIGSIMKIYGIEACRASIVKEISNVFGHYNITVDYRHLSLIADYMTFQGSYRSFNRIGMELASSPLLKVSFETSMGYLINSCIQKESDFGNSASSRIVLGLPPKTGSGMFDLVQELVK